MSCNCRNTFAQFLPCNYKPKQEEKPVQERPKVKVIKKKKGPVEEPQEENK